MKPRLVALVAGGCALLVVVVVGVVWFVRSGDDPAGTPRSGAGASPAASGSASAGASGGATAGNSSGGPDPALTALAGLVGIGCPDYAQTVPSGPGSVAAMASSSLPAAIAGNPLLTTLSAALAGRLNRTVDLTGALGRGDYTVFAPIDSAFAVLPASELARLKRDAPALRALLRAHVVAGRLTPAQVVGRHPTLAGGTLTVSGSGDDLRVGRAPLICGGFRTGNGTIYLIGRVLPAR